MDIDSLLNKQRQLMEFVPHDISELNIRRLVAGKGIVEEVHEYLNSTGSKPWRPNPLSEEDQLEEITDVLFFYLELVAMSTFTFDQIGQKYIEKWSTNIERYRKGKKGDWSWDDRATKKEL